MIFKKALEKFKPKRHFSVVSKNGSRYYLHKKAVSLRGGKMVDVFFFTKHKQAKYAVPTMPKGYSILENPRNGFLTIRRVSILEPLEEEEGDE